MSIIKIKNERRFKVKVYAFFQFISFGSYFSFMMSIGLMGYFLMVHGGVINDTKAWWQEFGDIVKAENFHPLATWATIFFYVGVSTLTLAYVVAFSIISAKKRNLYDSLFILFAIIPGISNVFALMAQVSTREITFAKAKINKKAIINAEFKKLEETRVIALKELENQNKLLEKMRVKNLLELEKKEAKIAAQAEKVQVKESNEKTKAKKAAQKKTK